MTAKSFDELAAPIDADPMRSDRAEAYRQEMKTRTFACQLAGLRGELGINQVDLASKLDNTQGEVSRLERSVDPKQSTLCKLTSALGGTLHIEINAGDRTVSFMHPPSADLLPQTESADPAPAPNHFAPTPAKLQAKQSTSCRA